MSIACEIAASVGRHTGSRGKVFLITWSDEFEYDETPLSEARVIGPDS